MISSMNSTKGALSVAAVLAAMAWYSAVWLACTNVSIGKLAGRGFHFARIRLWHSRPMRPLPSAKGWGHREDCKGSWESCPKSCKGFTARHNHPPALGRGPGADSALPGSPPFRDRKSTRLNSSHVDISYAVFCLKNQNHRIK